jgi:hypothetical protein
MSDLGFAALMAAIIRIESGAIQHKPVPYETTVVVKSLEIWYNRTVFPGLFDETWADDQYHLGYQTEGISNVSVETIANLQQGLVPDAASNLQQTSIEVYDYSEQSLPGIFPFPGLTRAQQINTLLQLYNLSFVKNYIAFFPWALPFACVETTQLMQWVRQDQNIEYLAANLEAGAIRAQWEGAQPTAEVLSWWHHRGIVTVRSEEELRYMGYEGEDLVRVLITQGEAQGYWNDLASWMMEDAAGLLGQ